LQRALEKLNDEFPAIALALVDEHGVVHMAASGWVGDAPTSPSTTVFPVASISKTIVACLCLQCCERGELGLDRDVNSYLRPDCHVRNPHFPAQPVTARHLLQHRSGLCDDEGALHPGIWRTEGEDCAVGLAEYVERRLNPQRDSYEPWLWTKESAPGEARWHYSNAGFSILGLILETVTCCGQGGMDQLAKERLFLPLGMTSSSFFLKPLLAQSDIQLAIPHSYDDGEEAHHYGVCEYPAASLRSTAQDLAKWLSALIVAPRRGLLGLDASTLLSDASLAQMLPEGEVCKQGLAWWGADSGYGNSKGRSWEHGGFMDGVRSHIYLWPHRRVGAVLMGNAEGRYKPLEVEIKAALSEHLGIPLKAFDRSDIESETELESERSGGPLPGPQGARRNRYLAGLCIVCWALYNILMGPHPHLHPHPIYPPSPLPQSDEL